MRILVTGARGFIGRHLCRHLTDLGMTVTGVVRNANELGDGMSEVVVGDIGPDTEWMPLLAGIDAVVHLAAQAHVPLGADLAAVERLNRDGAVRLAAQCAAAGVRRLVFLSSIKVNGSETPPDRPFTADQPPAPDDAYGTVKAEAERALAAQAGLDVVVIRPPLVHGPGAKGNLRALMAAILRRVPLPLGRVTTNRRSLVGVHNLASAIALCLHHPAAAGRTFLVGDGDALSTAALVRRLATGLGRSPLLLPVPPGLLCTALRSVGRAEVARQLTGSLVIDDTPIRRDLGWIPRYSLDDGLAAMAVAFAKERA